MPAIRRRLAPAHYGFDGAIEHRVNISRESASLKRFSLPLLAPVTQSLGAPGGDNAQAEEGEDDEAVSKRHVEADDPLA